ncbi:MAG TPA: hypothetical protein PLC79_11345 [Phycisphaerae bacterium]|nr:hypothetical protein [Phycisphaerae bacterium]
MTLHTTPTRRRPSDFAGKSRHPVVCILLAAALAGCQNQEVPPETLKAIVVGPVELYGVHLGSQATPQQVTYALMQALRDTAKAGQHHDRQAFKKGIETQLRLCAPSRIYSNVDVSAAPAAVASPEQSAVIYKIVKLWAPIAARYVDSFDADAAKAVAAMRAVSLSDKDVRVSYDVVDPTDQSRVIFQVYLTQEPGTEPGHTGEKFWRVYRLDYAPYGRGEAATRPAASRPAATHPATGPAA